jgi:chloramphenicol O-acetyltransferase type A
MKTEIRLENWNRREHFAFFSKFDEPYFGLVANVDCTEAYQNAKANNISFFIYYLFHAVQAVNQVEGLRYRIEDGKIYCYDHIHASATIGRDDTTFAFSFIPFSESLQTFTLDANREIEAIRNSSGLRINEHTARPDTVHYSSIPWLSFTGLSHARHFRFPDSVPKISFGKIFMQENRRLMPVSVHVHHALADGYHVGKFFEAYQQRLSNPTH